MKKQGQLQCILFFLLLAPFFLLLQSLNTFTAADDCKKYYLIREELRVTDKRMRKLIEKLGKIYPDYPAGCDHLKADLQKS